MQRNWTIILRCRGQRAEGIRQEERRQEERRRKEEGKKEGGESINFAVGVEVFFQKWDVTIINNKLEEV